MYRHGFALLSITGLACSRTRVAVPQDRPTSSGTPVDRLHIVSTTEPREISSVGYRPFAIQPRTSTFVCFAVGISQTSYKDARVHGTSLRGQVEAFLSRKDTQGAGGDQRVGHQAGQPPVCLSHSTSVNAAARVVTGLDHNGKGALNIGNRPERRDQYRETRLGDLKLR